MNLYFLDLCSSCQPLNRNKVKIYVSSRDNIQIGLMKNYGSLIQLENRLWINLKSRKGKYLGVHVIKDLGEFKITVHCPGSPCFNFNAPLLISDWLMDKSEILPIVPGQNFCRRTIGLYSVWYSHQPRLFSYRSSQMGTINMTL
jgi:hypothetical protein